MFDKIKQLNELKKLQAKLGEKKEETEINGVRVVINGKMKVEEVSLNPDLSDEENSETVKKCFNESVKKIQKDIAGSMGL